MKINIPVQETIKKRNSVRAYEERKLSTQDKEKLIKRVDVGIGLSHFHQTTLENGLSGKFEKLPQDNIDAPENTNYIISWIPEKTNKK